MKLKYLLPLFAIFSLLFVACGDDDDHWWDSGNRKVKHITINGTVVPVGTDVAVDTYFTTQVEYGKPKSLQLVIKLDPELQFVPSSSHLYIEGKSHRRSPDRYIECGDGTAYLFYDLHHSDDLRNYTGSKNFNMRFDFIAAAPAKAARVKARAGKTVEFGCDFDFLYQKEEAIRIE